MAANLGNIAQAIYSAQSPAAATVETYGVKRRVKIIGVLEPELEVLGMLNVQTTVWFAVAASLFSLAVGIWVTAAYTKEPTPAGTVLTNSGAPLLLILAVIFAAMAGYALRKRHTTISRVFKESLPGEPPAAAD